MYTYTQDDLDRFWTHVKKTGTFVHPTLGNCWEWTSQLRSGYGLFSLHGKPVSAHRLSFFVEFKHIDRRFICHHCDNHACVRPSHLFLGTHQENMYDMYSKDRGQSELTNINVVEARLLAHHGANIHDLARRYETKTSTILSAVRGKTFKHLESPCADVDISKKRKVSKLSYEDVEDILYLLRTPYWGQVNDIAKTYGVSHSSISLIKTGKYLTAHINGK